ncbi:hypothetical protein B9Q11_01340 [Candidatus Marsarchaeota G2 archaeon ECH_B_SAG-F08]|uniref:Uncharacterized protein n=2 Tax=Candidatus Marsarchaeota group 2 TaxID=2203771 RepID=A0A2R6BKS8_9ARCH|nr:MAG: hypothetical protein B9Q11_01340 [Candidatus Marsarchaeota G2 archaeon ECH_B_SAG-F08]PSO02374.1 MAG: hypothetical protein B9Q10_01400 [Candidatus Marsarchaeota G2 archaeon ECH_B_SAG-E12]
MTEKIKRFLLQILDDEKRVFEILEGGFRAVTPEAIEMWVKERVSLLPPSLKKLYFENQELAPLTKRVLMRYQGLIEYYLANPENTLRRLCEANPENAKLVLKEPYKGYILNELKSAYEYIKRFLGSES